MTDQHELETPVPPVPPPRHDGWWDAMIEAILEDLDGPLEETRERGLRR